MSRNLGRFTILAVAAALTVAFAAPAMADTTWTNLAGDGDWANGGNCDDKRC